MKAKILIAAVLTAAIATPAYAATYYVVQSNKTQKCSVTTKKPTAKSKTTVLVGNDAGYKSKKDANAAIATVEVCKTPT